MTLLTHILLLLLLADFVSCRLAVVPPPTFIIRTGVVTCASTSGLEVANGYAVALAKLAGLGLTLRDRNGVLYPVSFLHQAADNGCDSRLHVSLTRSLLSAGRLHFGFGSSKDYAESEGPLYNAAGRLLLHCCAPDAAYEARLPLVFGVQSPSRSYGVAALRFAVLSGGVRRLAVLYRTDDPYSTAVCEGVLAAARGLAAELVPDLKLVATVRYIAANATAAAAAYNGSSSGGGGNSSAQQEAAAAFYRGLARGVVAAGADAVAACDGYAESGALVGALTEAHYYLRAFFLATGPAYTSWTSKLGSAAEGLLGAAQWHASMRYAPATEAAAAPPPPPTGAAVAGDDGGNGTATAAASAPLTPTALAAAMLGSSQSYVQTYTSLVGSTPGAAAAAASAAVTALAAALSQAFLRCDISRAATADELLFVRGVIDCDTVTAVTAASADGVVAGGESPSYGPTYGNVTGYELVYAALQRLHFESFYGPLSFDADTRRNAQLMPATLQILGGRAQTIFPLEAAAASGVMSAPNASSSAYPSPSTAGIAGGGGGGAAANGTAGDTKLVLGGLTAAAAAVVLVLAVTVAALSALVAALLLLRRRRRGRGGAQQTLEALIAIRYEDLTDIRAPAQVMSDDSGAPPDYDVGYAKLKGGFVALRPLTDYYSGSRPERAAQRDEQFLWKGSLVHRRHLRPRVGSVLGPLPPSMHGALSVLAAAGGSVGGFTGGGGGVARATAPGLLTTAASGRFRDKDAGMPPPVQRSKTFLRRALAAGTSLKYGGGGGGGGLLQAFRTERAMLPPPPSSPLRLGGPTGARSGIRSGTASGDGYCRVSATPSSGPATYVGAATVAVTAAGEHPAVADAPAVGAGCPGDGSPPAGCAKSVCGASTLCGIDAIATLSAAGSGSRLRRVSSAQRQQLEIAAAAASVSSGTAPERRGLSSVLERSGSLGADSLRAETPRSTAPRTEGDGGACGDGGGGDASAAGGRAALAAGRLGGGRSWRHLLRLAACSDASGDGDARTAAPSQSHTGSPVKRRTTSGAPLPPPSLLALPPPPRMSYNGLPTTAHQHPPVPALIRAANAPLPRPPAASLLPPPPPPFRGRSQPPSPLNVARPRQTPLVKSASDRANARTAEGCRGGAADDGGDPAVAAGQPPSCQPASTSFHSTLELHTLLYDPRLSPTREEVHAEQQEAQGPQALSFLDTGPVGLDGSSGGGGSGGGDRGDSAAVPAPSAPCLPGLPSEGAAAVSVATAAAAAAAAAADGGGALSSATTQLPSCCGTGTIAAAGSGGGSGGGAGSDARVSRDVFAVATSSCAGTSGAPSPRVTNGGGGGPLARAVTVTAAALSAALSFRARSSFSRAQGHIGHLMHAPPSGHAVKKARLFDGIALQAGGGNGGGGGSAGCSVRALVIGAAPSGVPSGTNTAAPLSGATVSSTMNPLFDGEPDCEAADGGDDGAVDLSATEAELESPAAVVAAAARRGGNGGRGGGVLTPHGGHSLVRAATLPHGGAEWARCDGRSSAPSGLAVAAAAASAANSPGGRTGAAGAANGGDGAVVPRLSSVVLHSAPLARLTHAGFAASPNPLTPLHAAGAAAFYSTANASAAGGGGCAGGGGRRLLRSKRELAHVIWRLSRLQHPNVLPVLGIVWDFPGLPVPVLVTQYEEFGSLSGLLDNSTVVIDRPTRLDILSDVANALRYLYAQDDLVFTGLLGSATWRVYLDKRFKAKVEVTVASIALESPVFARGRAQGTAAVRHSSVTGQLSRQSILHPHHLPAHTLNLDSNHNHKGHLSPDAQGHLLQSHQLLLPRPPPPHLAPRLPTSAAASSPSRQRPASSPPSPPPPAATEAQFPQAPGPQEASFLDTEMDHEQRSSAGTDVGRIVVPVAAAALAAAPTPRAATPPAVPAGALKTEGVMHFPHPYGVGGGGGSVYGGGGGSVYGGGGSGSVYGREPLASAEPEDVYQFGLMALTLFVDTPVSLLGPTPEQLTAVDSLHPTLAALVSACTAPDPADRPPFAEIAACLAAIQLPPEPPPQQPPEADAAAVHADAAAAAGQEGGREGVGGVSGRRSGGQVPCGGFRVGGMSEEELREAFPPSVVEALKAGKEPPPEPHDEVSIFFSDIVGYTVHCSRLSTREVMDMLNRLYTRFDALIKELELFKVDVIGDAYLAVGNIRVKHPDSHAARLAQFAFRAVAVAASEPVCPGRPELGTISIRVGLAVGPVMACLVGTMNRRYSLFGNTVNVASRMESTSEPNKVQCTAAYAQLLRRQWPQVVARSRGLRNIKGKGLMETFFLHPPGSAIEELTPVSRASSADNLAAAAATAAAATAAAEQRRQQYLKSLSLKRFRTLPARCKEPAAPPPPLTPPSPLLLRAATTGDALPSRKEPAPNSTAATVTAVEMAPPPAVTAPAPATLSQSPGAGGGGDEGFSGERGVEVAAC